MQLNPLPAEPRRGPSALAKALLVLALLGVAALALVARPLLESRLIECDMQAGAAWKEVEVQLQRQSELIPKLVQVVKAYQAYESGVIDRVIAADRDLRAASAGDRQALARDVDSALAVVLRAAQRFPELAADQHYRDLAYELAGTKNRIAVARGRYNDAVALLNGRRRQFPWRLAASSVSERAFYDPPAETQVEPALDL